MKHISEPEQSQSRVVFYLCSAPHTQAICATSSSLHAEPVVAPSVPGDTSIFAASSPVQMVFIVGQRSEGVVKSIEAL